MRKDKTNGICCCSYEKLYRKLPGHYVPEVVLVVSEKCPIHGEIKNVPSPHN